MLLWAALVAWSLSSNIQTLKMHHTQIAIDSARSIFRIVILTRLWNASHGGVYVPVTEKTLPNPYLKNPKRDIETKDGLKLTMVNPAFMTRQLAELISNDSSVSFHITSLNPIRPENKADSWEAVALNNFELGEREFYARIQNKEVDVFRYMAPLRVEQPCMQCHEQQGYRVGDVRGGISVTMSSDLFFKEDLYGVKQEVAKHLGVFLIVSILLLIFLEKIRSNWLHLEHVKEYQESVIQERTKELEILATHDDLTGVFNRNAFRQQLEMEFERAVRYGHSLSVFMLDLDHFKNINDEYGHLVGDRMLTSIAAVITKVIRKTDFVARYGGEEFVVILPETGLAESEEMAKRLRLEIADCQIETKKGEAVSVTTSIGVATYPDHAASEEDLIGNADKALYKAKDEGRNRVVCCA